MALSNIQLDVLKRRKAAAKSALRFFKDKKGVKSTNNPFAFTTQQDQDNLDFYRDDDTTENSIVQSFEDAAHFGVGNCDEKARICYSSLVSNPMIAQPHSYVTLCEAISYDHVFVVIADMAITGRSQLKAMPETTMIVDGWTEDWYFPELSWSTAKWYGISNLPNPRQLYVRTQIDRHYFKRYNFGEGAMPKMLGNQPIISRVGT